MATDAAQSFLLSCAEAERGLRPVIDLSDYLQRHGREVRWLSSQGGAATDERVIESCDTFVALVGEGYSMSTLLNAHLLYADGLRSLRTKVGHLSRPRILAMSLEGAQLPPMVQAIAVEWLTGPQ